MTNDEFHEQLDVLAADTYAQVRLSHTPKQGQQAIRDALEEAIKLDHELHEKRAAA